MTQRTIANIIELILKRELVINHNQPVERPSHWFETEVPDIAHINFRSVHTPASYARIWRTVKAHAELYGLKITDVTQPGARESTWKIELLNTRSEASAPGATAVPSQSSIIL